ncbi:hypothetical protein ACFPIJ_41925 [Dactylosporangium cerinum]|uniref:Uncharacterized protein n=1 Tax=Dactylosporangium cerinum TaxID=1434730 RepID=A0ABV9W9L7_9ACTN
MLARIRRDAAPAEGARLLAAVECTEPDDAVEDGGPYGGLVGTSRPERNPLGR